MDLVLPETHTLHAALRMLEHYSVDAIIVDLYLPDSEGLETVRAFVNRYPEAVVITVSDREDIELGVHCIRYGAQDHIEKKYISSFVMNKSLRYSLERKRTMLDREELFSDFAHALEQLEFVENVLPLCVGCRKIRNAAGVWVDLTEYFCQVGIEEDEAVICPDCERKDA